MNASNAVTMNALDGMNNESIQQWQEHLRIDHKILFSFSLREEVFATEPLPKIRSLIEGGCLFSRFFDDN